MNMVSIMAGSNLYLDAIKMHFPTACEFYINHPQSSSRKNKNWERYRVRGTMTPSFPHCPCVFPLHQAHAILLQRGEGLGDSQTHRQSCAAHAHSLQDAVQVSSPKFIGRARGFLGSGLRGGCQCVDSWVNSSEEPRQGRRGNCGWQEAIGPTQGAGVGDPSSYKSVSSGNPELAV